MKRIAASLAAAFLAATPAGGEDIAVALTQELVEVDAGFSGARVVLFGALTGADFSPPEEGEPTNDIIAVVRGPAGRFSMRPMQRDGMIWTLGPTILVEAPSLLLTSASRDLDEIAPLELRRELMIGAERFPARIAPGSRGAAAHIRTVGPQAIGESFTAEARLSGRIRERADAVDIRKGTLFSIDIELPPTTPVGEYLVDVFLFRDGALVSQDSTRLAVDTVGLERRIHDLAHNRPIAYGIACVAVSLLAGWLAALAFRK